MAERSFNWLLLIPPAIFLSLGVLFWLAFQRENPDALPSALLGKPVPELRVEELPGTRLVTVDDFAGEEVKLVNFWASWCGPCRLEHPILEQLAEEGVPIIGINYKDIPDNAVSFLAELGDPYVAVGADSTGRTGIEWGIYGVPETFIINTEGQIVHRFPGPITESVLENIIRPEMEKAR